jgi:hypothetical protein
VLGRGRGRRSRKMERVPRGIGWIRLEMGCG